MDGIPIEGVTAPGVTVPLPPVYTPPSTGVTPATGWGWSPTGEPPCTRHNDGTVTWHGGTWTVPLAAKPGDSIADVNFTIEAPTGNAGDPQVVVVELFSSASPAALTQTQLTPMGMGNWVNSNAGLTSPHLVVSGETLQLVFVPLNGGDYAANDMKIDAVGVVHPSVTYRVPLDIFTSTNWFSTVQASPSAQAYIQSSGSGSALIWIPSSSDRQPVSITFAVESTSGGVFNAVRVLEYYGTDAAAQQLGGVDNLAPSASWSDVTVPVSGATPDGDLALFLDAHAAGLRVKALRVTYR